jgi:NAD-dependent deacetylase
MDRANLPRLAERLRGAGRVTVLTGAGVSAASGVPTFRGAGGLWRNYRPEDLATPEAFARDPILLWEWYAWRRATIASCVPNAAHAVLARWSQRDGGTTIVTQNVDDLHLRAGTAGLVRLHGSIWELSCSALCPAGATPWRDERVTMPRLPLCLHCQAAARPAVVWFGEALDEDDLRAALDATACDVFLTVGTSSVVYPAAGLVDQARRLGAFTAEINADATPATALVDLAIQGAAERVLPELDRLIAPSATAAPLRPDGAA